MKKQESDSNNWGGVAVFLVLVLGLGLGFGLQSDDEPKYKIFGSEYTESELINNGVTNNGVTYEFKKKDDGMYVTIPTGATFDTTTAMLEDTNFGRDLLVGGDNPQSLKGESNYFYIDYAAIGVVKIGNDGYVWGGFYTSNNSDPSPSDIHLRSGLSEPVQFAKINENGEALINLGKVHELQKTYSKWIYQLIIHMNLIKLLKIVLIEWFLLTEKVVKQLWK